MKIADGNVQPLEDILKDMEEKKTGAFTIQLTIHDGNIVDYVLIEVVQYTKNAEQTGGARILTDIAEGD